MARLESSLLLQSLHEISLELSTLPDTDALCHRAVQWGKENLGFDRVGLWFLYQDDPEWGIGTWGSDETGRLRDERHSRVRRDPQITPEEFYQGKIPVIFRKDEVCFDNQHREVGRADKAMAPLWDGKRIIGELAVDNLLSGRPIRPVDLDNLVLYARIIGHFHTLLRAREALARVSEDRGTLLKELKHRTRNNLSVIAGLINLESDRTVSTEVKEKFGALRDRVEALGALYSLLDQDEDHRPLRLDDYLGTVAHQLAVAHGADVRGIQMDLDLAPFECDSRRASALGLAVNELVTDSLKYGFVGGRSGKIRVSLVLDQGEVRLEVRDDGPGLPSGFRINHSEGFGLGLVLSIARQIGGTFEYGNDEGAVFSLRFKG